ncbi:glycosyltransferase family A protein [Flavobacterium poyangense]|uniref:glycosyltransferase family A protein n=1 Tax=Flavobacterium poyangense TaxID=2204302 RepID=UPI00141F0361|nr:glycosyltransferase family A protein [Flavobacterium sp. JXAS1]
MRVGFNPNKDKSQESNDFFHHVVIPVYIPDQEGYFKDAFKILQYCLESVFKTIHSKTYISIVNNGSHQMITAYLNDLFEKGKIHEIINTSNIGKLNAILKGISGHSFAFVTVTDCDVMFLKDWQKETYTVFEKFPKTGAVCPTPSSRALKSYTFNIWFELLFSKSLRFAKVKNPEALKAFAASVGKLNMYNSVHLEKYLTVTNGYFRAVTGAGHFVTTFRKEVFEKTEIKYSNFMLGGDSEDKLLDFPVVKKGMWRLSTEDNFAYHLGNVEEKWMQETLEQIKPNDFFPVEAIALRKIKSSKMAFLLKYKIFSRIIAKKQIWHYCLRKKGLTREEVLLYTQKYE